MPGKHALPETEVNMPGKQTALLLAALCVGALALALGCPDDDSTPDGTSLGDSHTGKKDGVGSGSEGGTTGDKGAAGDKGSTKDNGKAQDYGPLGDLGFNCAECLLEQVCVHFINSKTCKETKTQCKYRSSACYSPKTNPCCDCETQVCGLWNQCAKPAACPAPQPGSFDEERECFCYSK
jgi:hypothetical protein